MTGTADLPVLDVVSIEWTDEPTPCAGRRNKVPCPEPAVWWAEHHCGAVLHACEWHRAWVDRTAERNKRGTCTARCGGSWLPVVWHPLR